MSFTIITAKQYHLYEIPRGDDWHIYIPVYSDETNTFDLSSWQGHAQVRKKVDGSLIADFDTYDGTMEFGDGYIYLNRDKDLTNIKPSTYVWDCEFLDPLGYRRTLILESDFEIIGDVTL